MNSIVYHASFTVLLLFWGECAKIALSPSTLILENDQLTFVIVTCTFESYSPSAFAQSIKIRRSSITPPFKSDIIAEAVVTVVEGKVQHGSAVITDPSLTTSSVRGSTKEGSITLKMSDISCKAAGMYTCLTVETEKNRITSERRTLYIFVYPGNIKMSVSHILLPVSVSLVFKCSGRIGDPEHHKLTVEWVWEYLNATSKSWITYPHLQDISQDMPYRDPQYNCQMLQTTVLTRSLTADDDRRQYRCYVRYILSEQKVKNFEQYAAEYLIIIGKPPRGKPGKTSYSGLIIASIFGTLVVLFSGILVFLRYVRQKPKAKKVKKTKETKKSREETNHTPSATWESEKESTTTTS